MRQFLERMDKPRVDDIRGIPPAIAIEQSNPVKTSRSTVGTMTEINDYLKLLWPRIAKAFCPNCGREIRPETAKSIAEEVFALFLKNPHRNPLPQTKADGNGRRASVSPLPSGEEVVPLRLGPQPQVREKPTALITFWVSVPPKTEPKKFFEFLQQQGYLR